MNFEEWRSKNDGLCMSSKEYTEHAWNAAIDEAVKIANRYGYEFESGESHLAADEIEKLKE